MVESSILIKNVIIHTGNNDDIDSRQWLYCRGNTIHSFGPMDKMPVLQAGQQIDGTGKLLMPGLINGHNHCAMTLFRGMADDRSLDEWLRKYIFPAEAAHVNPDMVYWCTRLAAAEMILSGTTCVADGYFHEDRTAQALLDSGMRAVPAQGVIDFPAPGVPDPADNLDAARDFLDKWQDRHQRITPALFAHAPYTCSPKTLQAVKNLCRERKVPFFIHAAESEMEKTIIINPHGSSTIKHLAALDLLDRESILIHCVWLDDEDRKIISASGAGIILCPQSNAKLASGIADVKKMKKAGIRTGLGTDSAASNNSLDMFREISFLAKIQKMHELDPTTMTAKEAVTSACETNAAILGLNSTGTIRPGFKADLILLNMEQAHLQPCHSFNFLAYNTKGSDVDTVIIDGEVVLKDRTFTSFDLDECLARVNSIHCKINSF